MRPKYPPIVNVSGIGLPDTWQRLVNECMKNGALKRRFYGKPVTTYDIISTTEIKYPMLEPMLHPSFPTKELHLKEYEKQWERGYDWRKQGFEYNYMNRLVYYPKVPAMGWDAHRELSEYYSKASEYQNGIFIDQLKVIKETIAERTAKGGECLVSNRDQVITWIPDRDMFVNENQPCLQRIWFQVYEYPVVCTGNSRGIIKSGKVEFHVMWRSRDLFSAWNSNMIGLIKMLDKEIFEPNNLELVRVIDFCNSLHIYESDWEAASKIKMTPVNPQLMR